MYRRQSDDERMDLSAFGNNFSLSIEDFDKQLASELNTVENTNRTFAMLGDLHRAPVAIERESHPRLKSKDIGVTVEVPSSSTARYALGKSLPVSTMLPAKFIRHDEDYRRIHTATTGETAVGDDEDGYFDPSAMLGDLSDPANDINNNSTGSNLFVLSCDAVTNMQVSPRGAGEGSLTTPMMKKRVNDRYAEIQSLFSPPTNLDQHDVDVLNITIEARKYEQYYESTPSPQRLLLDQIEQSHEESMSRHVERLRKPKVAAPFNSRTSKHSFNNSRRNSLSPIRRRGADPFSDSEEASVSPSTGLHSSSPQKGYAKAKAARSPVLTMDSFAEVAVQMKEDIRFLVQDTIRAELQQLRKKHSRGGGVYLEAGLSTPAGGERPQVSGGGGGGDEGSVGAATGVAGGRRLSKARAAATPEGLEQTIERKIEDRLALLNEELALLRSKNDNAQQAAPSPRGKGGKVDFAATAPVKGSALSPVKPPGAAHSKTQAIGAVNNKNNRKLKVSPPKPAQGNEQSQSSAGASASFQSPQPQPPVQQRSALVVSQDGRRSPSRRLSNVSVTFSDSSPTPTLSASHPLGSSQYNRNFSLTPGGSLIHSFIDENREYAGATYEDYSDGRRRSSGGGKDFVAVGTPKGANIFGSTPVTDRLSSPLFSSELIPPQSPGQSGRAASPRGSSRSRSFDKTAAAVTSPAGSVANGAARGRNGSKSIVHSTPPDHVDARADVTIRLVAKGDSPSGKADVRPAEAATVAAEPRRRSVSESNAKDEPLKADPLFSRVDVNLVQMAPVAADVVQPAVVTKTKKRSNSVLGALFGGFSKKEGSEKKQQPPALFEGTTRKPSLGSESTKVKPDEGSARKPSVGSESSKVVAGQAAPAAPTAAPAPVLSGAAAVLAAAPVLSKPAATAPSPAKATAAPPVVASPAPSVKAPAEPSPAIKERTLSTPKVNTSPTAVSRKAIETPAKGKILTPAPAMTPAAVAPAVAPTVAPAAVPSVTAAAVPTAAPSRSKTADLMQAYDNDTKAQRQREEAAVQLGSAGYAGSLSSRIIGRIKAGGPADPDQRLSSSEVAVLDSEFSEVGKQIAQLAKIKSKIKKDLKSWCSDFEARQGRPPSTADKLEIEDRFLAYKTVMAEAEEAKKYSNQIAEVLRSSA